MKVYTNINENIPKNCIVTVGFFDGVHSGHKYILSKLKERAKELNSEELVVTLWPHPSILFSKPISLINTFQEKVQLLEDFGIKNLLVLDFSHELAKMTKNEFSNIILKEQLEVKEIVMGFNNSFGSKNNEDIKYKDLGLPMSRIDEFNMTEFANINSSEIRTLISNGEVEEIKDLLGYNYSLKGKIVGGYQIGRTIGFPTANIGEIDEHKLLPANGVYIIEVLIDEILYPAMLNIGHRPSFEGKDKTIEFHIPNFEADLYDKEVTIYFRKHLRSEKKFDSTNDLIKQLEHDKEDTVSFFL